LSCAWFLRQAGFEVDVFEQKSLAGGMVSAAIPSFRLTSAAIESDIQRILASGIQLYDNHPVDRKRFAELQQNYNVLFLAAGAQKSVKLKIEGIESTGVIDPLDFLFGAKQDCRTGLGSHVVIIGGGNTAMDAARTAYRMVGNDGRVTIVYRRTVKEMPADQGEIEAVKLEGIEVIELANPVRVKSIDGRVTGLVCTRNVLAMKEKDGRPVPIAVPGSEFEISCDTIIPAIGQQLAIDFLEAAQLRTVPGSYKTQIPNLYIGGDALRGASTAINAIADGRKAALEIIIELNDIHPLPPSPPRGGAGGGVISCVNFLVASIPILLP
jgi:putative selenate reductase